MVAIAPPPPGLRRKAHKERLEVSVAKECSRYTTSVPELVDKGTNIVKSVAETKLTVDLMVTLAKWWSLEPSFAQPAEGDKA